MLPPSSQRKSSQREDFELGLCDSHHLKNNPPKGRIPKRWDKNPVQEILPEGRIIDRILLRGIFTRIYFLQCWEDGPRTWTPEYPTPHPLPMLCSLKISRHCNNFSTCRPLDVQLCKSVEVTGKPQNELEGPRPM